TRDRIDVVLQENAELLVFQLVRDGNGPEPDERFVLFALETEIVRLHLVLVVNLAVVVDVELVARQIDPLALRRVTPVRTLVVVVELPILAQKTGQRLCDPVLVLLMVIAGRRERPGRR